MDNSPFARFPAELRNHVYELVFELPNIITAKNFKTGIALTQTCRQMRQEARAIYYNDKLLQLDALHFSSGEPRRGDVCNFLDSLGGDIINSLCSIVIVVRSCFLNWRNKVETLTQGCDEVIHLRVAENTATGKRTLSFRYDLSLRVEAWQMDLFMRNGKCTAAYNVLRTLMELGFEVVVKLKKSKIAKYVVAHVGGVVLKKVFQARGIEERAPWWVMENIGGSGELGVWRKLS